MTDKPQITTIDEAKAALDAEIADVQVFVDIYLREQKEVEAKLGRYSTTLYRLRDLRERMEPKTQPKLEAVA